jgi:hypothetical protein
MKIGLELRRYGNESIAMQLATFNRKPEYVPGMNNHIHKVSLEQNNKKSASGRFAEDAFLFLPS